MQISLSKCRHVLLALLLALFATTILLVTEGSLAFAQSAVTDAAKACAEGVELALDGKLSDAKPLLEQGFEAREIAKFSNRDDEGMCALILGMVRQSSGDLDGALDAFRIAESIFQETENRFLEMGTRNNIATVFSEKKQFEEALQSFQEVLAFLQEKGSPTEEFVVLVNIGNTLVELERLPEAESAYRDALDVAKRSEDLGSQSLAQLRIGQVSEQQTKNREAMAAYETSLDIARQNGDQSSEEKSWAAIGMLSYREGNNQRALEAFQEMLVLCRQLKNKYLESSALHNIGIVYRDQGSYDDAASLLNQALSIRRSLEYHGGEAETLVELGQVNFERGDFAAAKSNFEEALKLNLSVGDLTTEMQILNNMATLLSNEGDTELALSYLEQVKQHELELDSNKRATLWSNFGVTYLRQARFSAANEAFGEALRVSRLGGNPLEEAFTLMNSGSALLSQGQTGPAVEQLKQSLTMFRRLGNRGYEARALAAIGQAYANQSNYGRAIEQYNQALHIAEQNEQRAVKALILSAVGGVYLLQGRIEEAEQTLEEALSEAEAVGDVSIQAQTLIRLGHLYRVRGLLPEAVGELEAARDLLLKVGDKNNLSIMLSGLGEVYDDQARYSEALEAFAEALKFAREIRSPAAQVKAQNGTALVLVHQGRINDAIKILEEMIDSETLGGNTNNSAMVHFNLGVANQNLGMFDKAMAQYEEAMSLFETVREQAGSDIGRASYISQFSNLYRLAVALSFDRQQYREAFYISERARARAFLDSLQTGHIPLRDTATAELLEREQQTYLTRQNVQRALALERSSHPTNSTLTEELEQELQLAEGAYSATLHDLETRDQELASLVTGRSGVLTVTEVQALLDEDTTLVSYFLLEKRGGLAFVITRNTFDVVSLPEATQDNISNAVVDLRDWRSKDNAYPLPLRNLYDWLVAPIKGHLKTQKIGVIPYLWLHYIPFSALTDGERYFGDEHFVFELPSASALPLINRNAIAPHMSNLLVMANPISGASGLSPLAYGQSEGQAIGAMLNTQAYLGIQASEARLRSDITNARIVHIAAHARFNSDNPLYSAIYLAPGEMFDGLLEVHEVYALDLTGNELVVLSACETDVGQISSGDEIVGMTRAFFFAGAPTMIASLWPVDDAATEELMTSFYRYWLGGMSKVEALQAAQAEVRSSPTWKSPFYWAGFVLSGDPGVSTPATILDTSEYQRATEYQDSTPSLLLVIAGLFGGILLTIWREQRRRLDQ